MIKQLTLTGNLIIWMVLIAILLLPSHLFPLPYRLAILPYTIKADRELSSHKKEIFKKLSSLLYKKDTLTIISRNDIEKKIDPSEEYIDEMKALAVGEKLQADYVIYGSLTMEQNNITISTNLVDVSGISPMRSYKADVSELEQVIPQSTGFASSIAVELYPTEIESPLSSGEKEKGISMKEAETDTKPDSTKRIKQSQSDIYFTKEPWTSDILSVGIIGMSLADLDNDGKSEIVMVTPKTVKTFRYTDGKITPIADIYKIKLKYPVGIDVGDINGNGFPEIFITALDNYKSSVNSFVLEYNGNDYSIIEKNSNSYFRVVPLTDSTDILLGQKHRRNAPYKGKICRLKWNENTQQTQTRKSRRQSGKRVKTKWNSPKYIPEKEILPSAGINVLGLAYGKITKKEHNYVAGYDRYNNINVINNSGEKIWESREKYSGNTLYYQIDEGTSIDNKHEFLPVRIMINDINRDGINDVVAVKNYEIARNILGSFRFYNKHHIEILTWNGVSLITKYKSGIIYGFARDFAIGDIDNDGKKELIVAVIKREGKSIFSKPKSFLMVYKIK